MQVIDKPFPHAVIDNFISPETVKAINEQWPEDWNKEKGKGSYKWNTQKLPSAAQSVVDSIDIKMVEEATGIQGLFADPELFGAGLHSIPRDGYLKMHTDFNRHPKGWHRRVNVLIYLNEVWEDSWGGFLRLGEKKYIEIAPIGGRCVIFETNDISWHGHPEPLTCQENVQRRSLALYYYTNTDPGKAHTTIYKKAA
jgi:Rps23 Pro-64 3,4-dihydroxylase Tpa1-like proline 4-hydroxylase